MIYIQILDYKWSPIDFYDMQLEEEIARNYIKQVKYAISTEKFKFAPLSPQYLAYKRKYGLSLHTWEATSQLKNTLGYYRNGDIITIGWDKGLQHTNSKLKIYQIATILEFGTTKIPPRPLFRAVLRYFQSGEITDVLQSLPKSDTFVPEMSKKRPNLITSIKKSIFSKVKKKIESFFNIFKKR